MIVRRLRRGWLCCLAFGMAMMAMLMAAAPAPAEDAVILLDGFTLRGLVFKEKMMQFDGLNGPLLFTRLNAFDGIDQGAKYVFFSSHSKKGAALIEKDLPSASTLQFEMKYAVNPQPARLPGLGDLTYSEFDEKWRRKILARFPGGMFEEIKQQITFINPSKIYIASTSHSWRQSYATREFEPAAIRKLLITHPTLIEEKGNADPKKRMLIAEFMLEVGWLTPARDELARLKKEAPGDWGKELSDKYDQLQRDIDSVETRLIIDELELAIAGGRYQTAERYLAKYTPKAAGAKDLTKLSNLKVDIETVTKKYALARRLLRDLIDSQSGAARLNAVAAAASGIAVTSVTPKPPQADLATLLVAAEAVYTELHPDTVSRIEFFLDLANQAETRETPVQLLSRAVNGWLRGKIAGDNDIKIAVQSWNSRQMAIAYMQEEGQNRRAQMMKRYIASNDSMAADELSQVVTLLPPIVPEDLVKLKKTAIDPKQTDGIPNIYNRVTGLAPEEGNGLKYALRLPPEYHHGRSYPVIIALTSPGLEPEKMIAGLAADADKYGYIVAAVDWQRGRGGKGYDYSGREHASVHAILRELSRKFSIDSDKVFLFGISEGANFAMDMGISHPDLFAGVVAMGPNILWPFYQEYWRNAQKLPVYAVVGELSGAAFDSLRKMYDKWLPNGFPGLLTVYKGRSNEWFANELPTMFDWMSRKTRVRGTASLRLNATRFDPWQSMRDSDRRFYWVEFNELWAGNTMKPDRPQVPPPPATMRADIRKGNDIVIEDIKGVRKITIWLERDMINWENEVSVKVPYSKTIWKKHKLIPDPAVMFEHLYQTGDRKMLFFGKLEFDLAGN